MTPVKNVYVGLNSQSIHYLISKRSSSNNISICFSEYEYGDGSIINLLYSIDPEAISEPYIFPESVKYDFVFIPLYVSK